MLLLKMKDYIIKLDWLRYVLNSEKVYIFFLYFLFN